MYKLYNDNKLSPDYLLNDLYVTNYIAFGRICLYLRNFAKMYVFIIYIFNMLIIIQYGCLDTINCNREFIPKSDPKYMTYLNIMNRI